MQEKESLFVVGCGGHAKVVIDLLERQNRYQIAFLLDDCPSRKETFFCGYLIIGGREDLENQPEETRPKKFIVAIGDNQQRLAASNFLTNRGLQAATAIHPSAQLGNGVEIGAGTVIMAGTVINADSKIGSHVIINTGATVDHDCHIADGVHIAPGATLCGSVTIGTGTTVGAGATIIPGMTIGSHRLIKAGTTVTDHNQDLVPATTDD
ncbi:MAG: acetyltransferase [Deltaproteobacteria bacterium]|nr:acetyltransferase [Candidatus Anaeroferrophillus wilburensis]